jgi:hypothetical protein
MGHPARFSHQVVAKKNNNDDDDRVETKLLDVAGQYSKDLVRSEEGGKFVRPWLSRPRLSRT